MLKLGFALEGNSDYPVIPRLTRRVIAEVFPQAPLAEDSLLRPRKRGHGFISELPTFARQLQDGGAEIVVAVVDTDGTQINERLKLLREAKAQCVALLIPICIAEGLAVRKLEAWLLADEAAIFKVFDGDQTAVTFSSPEQEPDPKGRLNYIVRVLTEGREVTFASFAVELTEAIRLPLLRQRCGHFDEFARNLTNCVKQWQRLQKNSPARIPP
jgi:hypothetical protein